MMNMDRVAEIARAVLYEGYILYPYRPSAIKNRQRWTFGGIFPRGYAEAEGGDPWQMQTQCLLRGDPDALVEVRVRFLQLVTREICKLDEPVADGTNWRESAYAKVAALEAGGTRFLPWEEATEREIVVPDLPIAELLASSKTIAFAVPSINEREAIDEDNGVVAYLLRTGAALSGSIEIAAEAIMRGACRLTVRIENDSPWPAAERRRELAQRSAFASTHTALGLHRGKFVSLIDPPVDLREAATACDNRGSWPVLVGGECQSDTMLSSPIILYDDPQIAPESPGDLFDSTEIDEILTLRILAMTDAEKREMAATDAHARALLKRTEGLTAEEFGRLHGTLRRPGSQIDLVASDDGIGHPGDAKPNLASLLVDGRRLAVGAHVRLHPNRRADIMDIVLKDQIAVIEAIERDFEDRVHVAVTLLDDPGRDLGLDRYPGHRFFFAQDEIELLDPKGGR
jgi:hypothetical protein